jgi:hypothetical protein
MAISINHATKVITIPKTDTVFIETNATTGYEIRSYDEYAFMRELADYLDSEAGVALPSAFVHATLVVISGVTYARALSIVNGYTITFENGTYQVKLIGGTNNNILDALNPNNVSVIPANSAGLTQSLEILELFRLSGLDSTRPLVVTSTSRAAGDISQTIDDNAGTVTVTRQ